ncbi:hypothetical protein BLGI_4579 [Brevibacillus laterosporus GI-9]|nr:hypothetical protein BLGI_4579 [Brevibacillus laterosporus GI-9]
MCRNGGMMGKNHRTWFWMNYLIGKKTVWIGLWIQIRELEDDLTFLDE